MEAWGTLYERRTEPGRVQYSITVTYIVKSLDSLAKISRVVQQYDFCYSF